MKKQKVYIPTNSTQEKATVFFGRTKEETYFFFYLIQNTACYAKKTIKNDPDFVRFVYELAFTEIVLNFVSEKEDVTAQLHIIEEAHEDHGVPLSFCINKKWELNTLGLKTVFIYDLESEVSIEDSIRPLLRQLNIFYKRLQIKIAAA